MHLKYKERDTSKPGLSNLSAMVGRIDLILGMAGHYAISAALKATMNVDFINVII